MAKRETPAQAELRLLIEWERRCLINLDSHNYAERHYYLSNLLASVMSIGGPVALGAVAATYDIHRGSMRAITVLLALAAGLASVLLTVGDLASNAKTNRSAAREYGKILPQIELAALLPPTSEERQQATADIELRWNLTAEFAPNVPRRLRRRAETKRDDRESDRRFLVATRSDSYPDRKSLTDRTDRSI